MIRHKPTLDEFRNGGGDEPQQVQSVVDPAKKKGAARAKTASAAADDEKVSKTIRMRLTLEARIKQEVLNRRLSGAGRKYSESDLIEEALEAYFLNAKKK